MGSNIEKKPLTKTDTKKQRSQERQLLLQNRKGVNFMRSNKEKVKSRDIKLLLALYPPPLHKKLAL